MKKIDLFDIKEEELNKYIILDRKPIIFEENKHINNIVNYFIYSLTLPYEIKNKIGKYVLYTCKDINLKILEYLINCEEKTYINDFILTNNNIDYIKCYLNNCNYNLIIFHCEFNFSPQFYPSNIEICNIKKSNNCLLIFTNTNSNYYSKNSILYLLSNVIKNNKFINKYKNEDIETCFNIDFFTNINIEMLTNYMNEEFELYNYGLYRYLDKDEKEKSLLNIFMFVTLYTALSYIKGILLAGDIDLDNKYVNIKDFSYSLIKHMNLGNAVIITIDDKYIIFCCPNIKCFKNGICNLLLLELNKIGNIGNIVIPHYPINKNKRKIDIYKKIKDKIKYKKKINIHEFINYDILILNEYNINCSF